MNVRSWVCLSFELILLEIESSFLHRLLQRHTLWLDCPVKERKRAKVFLYKHCIVGIPLVLAEGYRGVRVKQVNGRTQTGV